MTLKGQVSPGAIWTEINHDKGTSIQNVPTLPLYFNIETITWQYGFQLKEKSSVSTNLPLPLCMTRKKFTQTIVFSMGVFLLFNTKIIFFYKL